MDSQSATFFESPDGHLFIAWMDEDKKHFVAAEFHAILPQGNRVLASIWTCDELSGEIDKMRRELPSV